MNRYMEPAIHNPGKCRNTATPQVCYAAFKISYRADLCFLCSLLFKPHRQNETFRYEIGVGSKLDASTPKHFGREKWHDRAIFIPSASRRAVRIGSAKSHYPVIVRPIPRRTTNPTLSHRIRPNDRKFFFSNPL